MNVTMRMIYGDAALRPAAAWFVAGPSAEVWLQELVEWRTPLAAARLYIVAEPQAVAPCGVLVLGAAPGGTRPRGRALPYGLIGSRLYLPVEACVEPSLGDAELDELTGSTAHCWHPLAGLLALNPEFACRVADLLAAPPSASAMWDAAVPGLATNARLLSVKPEAALTIAEVLQGGRDDIGTEAPRWDQLPPAPDEPAAGAASNLWRQVQTGWARAVRWLLRQLPHNAPRRTWVNDAEDWAARQLQQLARADETARNREVHRLLELLKSDPDAGLRFAIPFAGELHRGLAEPSNQLGERNIDFDLHALGGGRPADPWNLPADYQRKLRTSYRDLAARELALGRYRRAAYIFATLLADVPSAAAALARGRHWREAAALYEQRLDQPAEAARCLREGGLLTEAIAIYERLKLYEVAGDLYQELERSDEANTAWRRAVDEHLGTHDRLSATRILEHKLSQADAALELLIKAWPASPQAEPCLTAAFSLVARQAWHEKAVALVAELPASTPVSSRPRLLEELVRQAQQYPTGEVRSLAADQGRIVAADLLETADGDQASDVVRAIRELAPQDDLLARDAERFLVKRRAARPATRQKPAGKAAGKLAIVRTIELPAYQWRAAVAVPGGMVAVGYRDRELKIVRAAWADGAIDELHGNAWKIEPRKIDSPLLLACDDLEPASVFVHVLGEASAPLFRGFAKTSSFPETLMVRSNAGLSTAGVGMVCSMAGWTYVVNYQQDDSLVISVHMPDSGEIVGLASLERRELIPAEHPVRFPLPMAVREGKVFLGWGQKLLIVVRGGLGSVEFPRTITQLAVSAPHTRPRVGVAMEKGGAVLWGLTDRAAQTPFAAGISEPCIALTRGGRLIAAGQERIEVYNARDGQVRLHGACDADWIGGPLAVLLTAHAHQFAVVGAGGRVQLMRVED